MNSLTWIVLSSVLLWTGADVFRPQPAASNPQPGLKEVFAGDFFIGAALNNSQIQEKDSLAKDLIPAQFNSVTAENIMKCEIIHPGWSDYNFTLADQLAAYSEKHQMQFVGHTLIWHSQLAPFVRQIKSADSLDLFMKTHITTIASRYKGKVDGWDVVNEALEENGSMRKSIFYNLLGDAYIEKAFQYAQDAAPGTELYYNDYNIEQPAKRAGAIALVKRLKEKGIRIDGVGIQGHWSINSLNLQHIEESIQAFSALGVKVMFTELDLTVLPNPWDLQGADVNQNFQGNPAMNPYPQGLPDSVNAVLADKYKALFALFLKHKESVSRVTFWGVSDRNSWLNNWPIRNRTNYPLVFDRNYQPKPAYYSILSLKK
ncbi:MAG: endo-1,4-beta-xylanase [Haliscomenobacter sp.]|nr:endo-1,4-beta-xylanase [Haliscomenobacter sp.]MBP9078354.1 endo-1,4-beta-xylanase [Haliscomenobacter sp.]MBP9874066.1 endo-1,4-beta-xylanase [Haliscomenobacter sp.]